MERKHEKISKYYVGAFAILLLVCCLPIAAGIIICSAFDDTPEFKVVTDSRTGMPVFSDPDSKNNLDLAAWAVTAYENKWGYVYGTWGDVLTEETLSVKLEQYPISVGQYESFIREDLMNRHVVDCVGLIKGYCWYQPSGKFEYLSNNTPDVGANGLFEASPNSGTIDSIPETVGLAVWAQDHIGIYIGDGWVIDAKGTMDGVLKTRLVDRPWTHWCGIPYIEYIS